MTRSATSCGGWGGGRPVVRTLAAWICGWLAAGLGAAAAPASAQEADEEVAMADGLVFRARPLWDVSEGFVPFRLEVERDPRAVGPPRERKLTIVFEGRDDHYRGQARFTTKEAVLLPASEMRLRTIRYAPAWTAWGPLELKVLEGGRELSGFRGMSWRRTPMAEDCPAATFASFESDPFTTKWTALLDAPFKIEGGRATKRKTERVPFDALPNRVFGYAGMDVVAAPAADFLAARAREPQRYEALRAWTLSGGALVLVGCGDAWEECAEAEAALVGAAPGGAPAAQVAAQSAWKSPEAAQFDAAVQRFRNQNSRVYNSDGQGTKFEAADWSGLRRSASQIRGRTVGFGTLVCVQKNFRGDLENEGSVLLYALLGPQVCAAAKLGGGAQGYAPNVSQLDMKDIGKPPVVSFQILITLFVLIIGPVNYFYLRKRNLAALTVVTVPAFGAVVTVGFLLFAFVSEGFHTRGRSRSYTQLTPAGDAVSWTRLSLYCGLAPPQGLFYDMDTTVLPLFYAPPTLADGDRLIEWTDRQNYREGWSPSRTPIQFMCSRVRKSPMKLVVEEHEGAVRVRNELGAPIRKLLLCDRGGKLHRLENLAAGGAAPLEPAGPAAEKDWRKLLDETQPLEAPDAGDYFDFSGRRPRFSSVAAGPPVDAGGDLLEERLGLPRPAPGGWAAVVERSPEVEWGVAGVVEEDRLHVVAGQY